MANDHVLNRQIRYTLPEEEVQQIIYAGLIAVGYENLFNTIQKNPDLFSNESKVHIICQKAYFEAQESYLKGEACRRFNVPPCKCYIDSANNALVYRRD